jgi:hypothetical protein
MHIQYVRNDQREIEGQIFALGTAATPDLRRVERVGREKPHECDQCGEITPDVDLWAEDFETGEELWLCKPCGDW